MIQIIFHALGGQGAKSAADILANAAFAEGMEIQAFPEFGPERRGTPVRAFVRISERKITTHEPIVTPNYTVIIEPTLTTKQNMAGICVVNSEETAEALKKSTGYGDKIHTLDASKLHSFANLPMLAAFVKVSKAVKMESIIKETEELFGEKLGKEKTKQSIEAMEKAYQMTK